MVDKRKGGTDSVTSHPGGSGHPRAWTTSAPRGSGPVPGSMTGQERSLEKRGYLLGPPASPHSA